MYCRGSTVSPQRSLAELVRDQRERLGVSLRQVDADTERLGRRVSYSTLNDLEMGQRTTFPDETLAVIARALHIPVTQIRRAAGRPDRAPRPFVLPQRAAELSGKERQVVVAVVEALLAAKDGRR